MLFANGSRSPSPASAKSQFGNACRGAFGKHRPRLRSRDELVQQAGVSLSLVLYFADAELTPFSAKIIRQTDQLLIVGDAAEGVSPQARADPCSPTAGLRHVA